MNAILKPDNIIQEFLDSLGETLEKAERTKKLGLTERHDSALKTFLDYGNLIELAFSNQMVSVQDILYFGMQGGRIGIPEIQPFIEEDEDDVEEV